MSSRIGAINFRAATFFVALAITASLEAVTQKSHKVYDGIVNDVDLFVGEGIIRLSDFGEDLEKAKAKGRSNARGHLAESIKVRIVSSVTDSMSTGSSGERDNIVAVNQSSSELELEGIQYKYLDAFPTEGRLTVLATISKEEYRRQQEKRILGFRPERALRIYGGAFVNLGINEAFSNLRKKTSPTPPTAGFGIDFYRNNWFAGAIYSTQYDYSVVMAKVGYEFLPWKTRFQLVLPVQAEVGALNWDSDPAIGAGLAGGARLRYWASDRVAFDVGGLGHYGLTSAPIRYNVGDYKSPSYEPVFKLSGFEVIAGLTWNGF